MQMLAIDKTKVRRTGGHALTFRVPESWLQTVELSVGDQVYVSANPIEGFVRYEISEREWAKAVKLRLINERPVMTVGKKYAAQAGISEGDEIVVSVDTSDFTLYISKA